MARDDRVSDVTMIAAALLIALAGAGGKCSDKRRAQPVQESGAAEAQRSAPAQAPEEEEAPRAAAQKEVVRDDLEGGPYPALLMVQSQFLERDGKPVPGPARLDIVRRTPDGWREVVVEDPESNVFHKAVAFTMPDGREGVLTIGAMKAMLKFWWWDEDQWKSETLWEVSFGGKFDRLRDMELGDVNGDGEDEIVVATHDQGVVAVVSREGDAWKVDEIDRVADTFVHEIEIGDVDGDGKPTIFATPSKPNKVGQSQSGKVIRFDHDGEGYVKSVVESWDERHVKEILAADLDGDGTATLFAVVEAELEKIAGMTRIEEPVEVRRFDFSGDEPTSRVIGTIEDAQTRFLTFGDVEDDGEQELVAAAMKTGLWILRPGEQGQWTTENFEEESSGYEHSTVFADLDGDGAQEIYVAADDQKTLNRYVWEDGELVKQTVVELPSDVITWNLMPARI
jgi:hypothetical protein